MTARTFSGAHPFRPACLVAAYEECLEDEELEPDELRAEAAEFVANLVERMGEEHCLRCGKEFAPKEIPSGSRVTDCRCVPICHVCAEAEGYQSLVLDLVQGPDDGVLVGLVGPVCDWPIDADQQDAAVREFRRRYLVDATIRLDELGESPANSGGWLEHGYDTSADEEEERGR